MSNYVTIIEVKIYEWTLLIFLSCYKGDLEGDLI